MNKSTFLKLLHNVSKNLYYKDIDSELLKYVSQKYKFTILSDVELSEGIDKLKSFDINKLWDKGFWKLGVHESISAVATEPYNSLIRIRDNY